MIIERYKGNPILTKNDIPYEVSTVHNAAVVKTQNQYVMLFRSHTLNGRSIIGLAKSGDGLHFTASSEPFMTPAHKGDFKTYEEYGVEDPRIVFLEGEYYITYSAYSRYGVRIGLAKTQDFRRVERLALISQADMRNVVLFPEKINGQYVRLDRPHTKNIPYSIWISYSKDLIHWGESKIVLSPKTYHWTSLKIGPGAPPIKTPAGWLNIFHGAYNTMNGAVYRLGVALHKLEDPSQLIDVSDHWILEPETPHERTGYVPNVVFTCAAVPEEDGGVKIYWGAADTCLCVGFSRIEDLLQQCMD